MLTAKLRACDQWHSRNLLMELTLYLDCDAAPFFDSYRVVYLRLMIFFVCVSFNLSSHSALEIQ